MNETEELEKSIHQFSEAMKSITPSIQEFADAISKLGVGLKDMCVLPHIIFAYGCENSEESTIGLVEGNSCVYDDDKRSGFGIIIGIGDSTYTIKSQNNEYVTLKKCFVKRWGGNYVIGIDT